MRQFQARVMHACSGHHGVRGDPDAGLPCHRLSSLALGSRLCHRLAELRVARLPLDRREVEAHGVAVDLSRLRIGEEILTVHQANRKAGGAPLPVAHDVERCAALPAMRRGPVRRIDQIPSTSKGIPLLPADEIG